MTLTWHADTMTTFSASTCMSFIPTEAAKWNHVASLGRIGTLVGSIWCPAGTVASYCKIDRAGIGMIAIKLVEEHSWAIIAWF